MPALHDADTVRLAIANYLLECPRDEAGEIADPEGAREDIERIRSMGRGEDAGAADKDTEGP